MSSKSGEEGGNSQAAQRVNAPCYCLFVLAVLAVVSVVVVVVAVVISQLLLLLSLLLLLLLSLLAVHFDVRVCIYFLGVVYR